MNTEFVNFVLAERKTLFFPDSDENGSNDKDYRITVEKIWNYLERTEQIDPDRFQVYHPSPDTGIATCMRFHSWKAEVDIYLHFKPALTRELPFRAVYREQYPWPASEQECRDQMRHMLCHTRDCSRSIMEFLSAVDFYMIVCKQKSIELYGFPCTEDRNVSSQTDVSFTSENSLRCKYANGLYLSIQCTFEPLEEDYILTCTLSSGRAPEVFHM